MRGADLAEGRVLLALGPILGHMHTRNESSRMKGGSFRSPFSVSVRTLLVDLGEGKRLRTDARVSTSEHADKIRMELADEGLRSETRTREVKEEGEERKKEEKKTCPH